MKSKTLSARAHAGSVRRPLPELEELGLLSVLGARRDMALRALSDENALLREEIAALRARLEGREGYRLDA